MHLQGSVLTLGIYKNLQKYWLQDIKGDTFFYSCLQ